MEAEAAEAVTSTRTCGSCTLCCKVLGVQEIGKPRNTWCRYVAMNHQSCTIHEWKPIRTSFDPPYPKSCKTFKCLWLERPLQLPDWMRPDLMHAFFSGTVEGDGLVLHVDPGYPMAFQDEPLASVIQYYHQQGVKLLMMIRSTVYMMRQKNWYECQTTMGPDGHVSVELKGVDPVAAGIVDESAASKFNIPFKKKG